MGQVDIGDSRSADNGAAGLGLLMMLSGGVWLGLMGSTTFNIMSLSTKSHGGGSGAGAFILFGLVSMVRSGFHMAAGSSLLNAPARNQFSKGPLYWTYVYIGTALVHTVLFWLLLKNKMHMKTSEALPVICMLAAWPLTLLVAVSTNLLGGFKNEIPEPTDRGIEQAGVLMAILGTIGTIFAVLILVMVFKIPKATSSAEGIIALLICVSLVVRSVLHANAGFKTVQGGDLYDATSAVARYNRWGVGTAMAAASGLFLMMVMNKFAGELFIMILTIGYLLFLWPYLVGRFVMDRSGDLNVYGDERAPAVRSPDMGLTALGWLLVALAVLGIAAALPTLLLHGPKTRLTSNAIPLFGMADFATASGRSLWWSVGASALQLWAGIELLGMRPGHKIAAWVYGVGATATTLYMAWPVLKMLDKSRSLMKFGSPMSFLAIYAQLALALVIPVGTLLLVLRRDRRLPQARVL